ncbi:MAG: hypothetical protein IJW67_02720, partial [Blautia sp.]|nr:hypothetical protein [Blautia sp.]
HWLSVYGWKKRIRSPDNTSFKEYLAKGIPGQVGRGFLLRKKRQVLAISYSKFGVSGEIPLHGTLKNKQSCFIPCFLE